MRTRSLNTELVGKRIHHFEIVDSTNRIASEYADDPAHDGLVILANEQTAGRGRQGRTWLCPPGCGILMSVVLFPPEHLCRPVILTALAAVAVCETIYSAIQLPARIKWPNDVLLKGRKVCGILIEHGRGGIIVGIGLNVNTPAHFFAKAGLDQAGSLARCTGGVLNMEKVVESLICKIDDCYTDVRSGNLTDLQAQWVWNLGLWGRQVCIEHKDGRCAGRLLECTFDRICLESAERERQSLSPESIRTLLAVMPA